MILDLFLKNKLLIIYCYFDSIIKYSIIHYLYWYEFLLGYAVPIKILNKVCGPLSVFIYSFGVPRVGIQYDVIVSLSMSKTMTSLSGRKCHDYIMKTVSCDSLMQTDMVVTL